METVWKALSFKEPVLGSFFVELKQRSAAKRQPYYIKTGFFRLLDPLFIWRSLKACCRPVPRVLRLHDVQFPVKAESHRGVACK